jgi:signal transduction histidine kinase
MNTMLELDPERMGQVLTNLLNNAINIHRQAQKCRLVQR